MTTDASTMTDVAHAFFDACDTGKGWAGCHGYCHPDAAFTSQAEPLVDVHTLSEYTEWMKGMLGVLPDGRYEMKSFATDQERNSISAFAVFSGTHTGEGGPVAPTGKSTSTDYVYVMQFDGGKICAMTKIWNAGLAMKDLGWTS
jgi:predicted ester cyclase